MLKPSELRREKVRPGEVIHVRHEDVPAKEPLVVKVKEVSVDRSGVIRVVGNLLHRENGKEGPEVVITERGIQFPAKRDTSELLVSYGYTPEEAIREIVKIIKNRERVDPGYAAALIRMATNIKPEIYGSVRLGVENPGDIDVFVQGSREERELVGFLLRKLTGIRASVKRGTASSDKFHPIAGKIHRIVRYATGVGNYGRRQWKVYRDLLHVGQYLERIERADEKSREILVDELLYYLKRRFAGNENMIKKFLERGHLELRRQFPDASRTIQRVVELLQRLQEQP
ncbi:MAG: hypothetical protein GXO00_02480 [Candidatus Diapherotrites archaeon]|nr:hypothetical protein [Candidatus Diapherotrites archaeon]